MMHKALRLTGRSVLSAFAAATMYVGAAAANERSASSGDPAEPPAGFLDLCRREPAECAELGFQPSEIRARAQALYWSGIFNTGVGAPASVETLPDSPQPALGPKRLHGDVAARVDQPIEKSARSSILDGGATPTSSPPRPPWSTITLSLSAAAAPALITMGVEDWNKTDQLNREINRRIRAATDRRLYGVGDYWTLPAEQNPRGDCEDYVLAKRRALIDAGYSPEAFSIALVETRWGESHAVLLMATSDGEFVLDNLTPRILRTVEVDYLWRKRQIPGRALAWVSGR